MSEKTQVYVNGQPVSSETRRVWVADPKPSWWRLLWLWLRGRRWKPEDHGRWESIVTLDNAPSNGARVVMMYEVDHGLEQFTPEPPPIANDVGRARMLLNKKRRSERDGKQ